MIEVEPSIEMPSSPDALKSFSNEASSDSRERFEGLSRWLQSNIESVVQRSLRARSQQATLTLDAPSELRPTVQIADGVVLLIGTTDYPDRLALVLPGSYIGAQYYSWFEIPVGTNERVEGTVEPAVVREDNGDFVVVTRGLVRQN